MTTCSEGLSLRAPCARSRHRVCRKNAGAALSLEAALRYAAANSEESAAALRETMAVDVDALRRLLPGTQVIDMDMADGS